VSKIPNFIWEFS